MERSPPPFLQIIFTQSSAKLLVISALIRYILVTDEAATSNKPARRSLQGFITMQSQLILNYALQFVVLGFTFLLVFDFINGLFDRVRGAYIASSVNILPYAPESKAVFEQIADPWFLESEALPGLARLKPY
jgi:hypothetical protein